MNLNEIQEEAFEIWNGCEYKTASNLTTLLAVVLGDVARIRRSQDEEKEVGKVDRMRELGNILTTTIRYMGYMNLDPEECVRMSLNAQRDYVEKLENK